MYYERNLMRFKTIWTLKGMPLREKLSRTREWLNMTVAAHLPQRLKYWVTIQEIGKASKDSPNIPATPLDQILRNLEKG
jgi:hypothetical protein